MIPPATASQIGGVKLNGILGAGTADTPVPPDGYITAAMLHDAYALASALMTETNRAVAAETAIATANNASYQAAITYMNEGISAESGARVAAAAAIQSTLDVLTTEVTDTSSNVGTFYATLSAAIAAEASTRSNGDATLTSAVAAVRTALNNEITRAEGAEDARLIAARNFADLTDIIAARANLGIGSAALHAQTDFDPVGAAAAVQALLVTETSRALASESSKLSKAANLADLTSAATARGNLGLGSASTQASSAFDAAGTSAAEAARALAAEALLAPLSNTLTLSGSQTVTGNKNFSGTLSQGGNAVVVTTDARLSDARNPLTASVIASSIANGVITAAKISSGAAILATQLAPAVQTSLALANSSVQAVNGHTGSTITLVSGDIGAIGQTLYTTKGDILAAGGANDPINLAVGPDHQVLTADSASGVGVSWQNAIRRYDVVIGDGTTTSFPITHNLGQQYVLVQTFTVSSGAVVPNTGYTAVDAAHLTLTFASAPAASAVHVVILG